MTPLPGFVRRGWRLSRFCGEACGRGGLYFCAAGVLLGFGFYSSAALVSAS
jgi:hypothetical protein